MEKLIEKFEELVDGNDCLVAYKFATTEHCILPEQYKGLSIDVAQECRKVTIQFYNWLAETDHTDMHMRILFNQFIKEEYK